MLHLEAALAAVLVAGVAVGAWLLTRGRRAAAAPLFAAALASAAWLAHAFDVSRAPLILIVTANVAMLLGFRRGR